MSSTRKAVIVRKFSRDWLAGYVSGEFGQQGDELEVLDSSGRLTRIPWKQVKWLCFVRDFAQSGDRGDPERLLRRRFALRPRQAGLWLRLRLADGDELEGLAANDRSLIDGAGLMMSPPDMRSNTQRLYIPRTAIETLTVLALIGNNHRQPAGSAEQPELFPAAIDT